MGVIMSKKVRKTVKKRAASKSVTMDYALNRFASNLAKTKDKHTIPMEAIEKLEKYGALTFAKVFNNGGSQAVRLPKKYRFDADKVAIRREGDDVILSPVPERMSWAQYLLEVPRVDDDFVIEDLPLQERDFFNE